MIDAGVEVATPAYGPEVSGLLFVDELHVLRVTGRDYVLQLRLAQIPEAQCGIGIAAGAAIDDAGRRDLYLIEQPDTSAVLVDHVFTQHRDGQVFHVLGSDKSAPVVVKTLLYPH